MIVNYFVEKFETLDDEYRAEVLMQLERKMRLTSKRQKFSILVMYGVKRDENHDEVTCFEARFNKKPLPHANYSGFRQILPGGRRTEDKPRDLLRESKEHLRTCPACIQWELDGMPYEFDFFYIAARQCLCGLMKKALAHKQEWILSYTEALKHAHYCEECNKLRNTILDSNNCVKVREHLINDSRYRDEVDYVFKEPITNIDAHVENCEECQIWCHDKTTCEQTRNMITDIIKCNDDEWKRQRWLTVAPIELHHITRCSDCFNWIQNEFYQEYKKSYYSIMSYIEDKKEELNQIKRNSKVICIDQKEPDYEFISKSERGEFDYFIKTNSESVPNRQRRRGQVDNDQQTS